MSRLRDAMRLAALIALSLLLHPAAAPQRRAGADFAAWRATVLAHQPGTLPAATRALGEWPWDRLEPVVDELRVRGTSGDLLRAAALYLDLALEVPLAERPVYPTRGGAVFSRDGRPLTTHRLDSQVWTARTLVGMAITRAGSGEQERRLAHSWFRAVTAVFAQRLNLADLQPHLAEVLKYMPEDPGALFDAGCAAETLASPLIQATLGWREPESTLSSRLPGRPPSGIAAANRPAALLATAEKHYRAVLRQDPSDREARVRLGRVLADLGRNDDALAELQAAATVTGGARIVQYYNWLFLGDVLTDLGRLDDAHAEFERAAALYPHAGSPGLGISRVLSERGDMPGARRALGGVISLSSDTAIDDDPRWQYNRCLGRDAHAVYTAYVDRFRNELR